ncbi:uncharacterized protein DUF402 [Asanoa ferruginea]|uniref:Uncharacterized protein DUF402 n=1 Tax=Asanoa ferruginea TaxID=53367 RepID=A0A3D9ZT62_9ACTN|nr:DUF402 domain-containing protein [Asanoa ferruginea]REG00090.1 uncharacterized protein DUF402 [Asanoa ferruginea]GIF46218.1 hypothetical protein Afe04nite_07570 [Asanoa ferruginea]
MNVFSPGAVVDRREVLHGRPWVVTPVRVVEDTHDELAVFLAEGTPLFFPDHPFGAHPWSARERWGETSVLQVQRPGDAHAVWGFFEQGAFTGWYVNFQAPMRRWSHGFDTVDHGVDIWIPGGGPDWQWKDRDDVADLVRAGRLTAAEADDVWAETDKVAQALDRGERWWSRWDGWTPEPNRR